MAVFSADRFRRVAGPAEADAATAAGFPSPARDYFDGRIDLNRHLISDPTSTYVVRVDGDSMADAGICSGDELIVDRSRTPHDGAVVVAVVDGELLVRRLLLRVDAVILRAESHGTPDIELPDAAELTVWGVVTRCLHHV